MSPTCSARGCRAEAPWALRWNNPRLHTPERRKTWLACERHRASLGDFLAARGFLRETLPFEELPADEGPGEDPGEQPDGGRPTGGDRPGRD